MVRLGLVLILAAIATVAGWRLLDRHVSAADVEGPLQGVTYAPWAKDQDPIAAKASGIMSFLRTAINEEPAPPVKPRREQVERDFAMLAGKVGTVRTYRTTDGGEYMPEIAARVGLKLVPGAWIYSANEAKLQFGREASEVNAEETRALIRMANQNPNIERVLVGNENILRWDGQKDLRDPNATSPAQLIREIRNVKRNVKVPVSTAEPWHVWLNYPELAKEVDYLAVHILPYWDEQSSETPLDYIKDKIGQLRKAYPNKNIVVTEVGWPSNGAERRSPATGLIKHATPAEQARNVRDMVAWLKAQNIQYFVVEAIDQPWKSYDLEGKAGGYWGLWNADRQQKFEWTGPVETFPQWWVYAAWSLAAALPLMVVFLWYWSSLRIGRPARLLRPRRAVDQCRRLRRLGRGRDLHGDRRDGRLGRAGLLPGAEPRHGAGPGARAGRDDLAPPMGPRGPAGGRDDRAPAGRPALAQGLDPRRDLQRAAGDGDPDHRIAGRASTIPTSKSSSSTTTPRTRRCGGRCRTTAPSSASASSSSTSTS